MESALFNGVSYILWSQLYSISFRGQPAPISCLASRTGQTTSNTSTLSSPRYDRGAPFRRCTHQGCKKLVGKKLLVDRTYEDQIPSFILSNCVIKAGKDEKLINWQKLLPMSLLLFPPPFRKSSSETVNKVCTKKVKSLAIIMPKRSESPSQDLFL